MRKQVLLILILAGALTADARPASALWFAPIFGSTFSTAGSVFTSGLHAKKPTYGFKFAGTSVVAAELDFGYTPNFFDNPNSNQVTTLMGNLIINGPKKVVRPYVSGGLGLIRQHVPATQTLENLTKNDLGGNLGGGIRIVFGTHFGVLGDIRYFKSRQDKDLGVEALKFWRGVVGIVLESN